MIREEKYLCMMNQWLILKHEGKSIERYFVKNNFHLIAIYGMGTYARHMIRELRGSNITIAYGIDQKKMMPYEDIKIIRPIEKLSYVDGIINTVIHDHTNIINFLAQITEAPILSLEDVVFESYDE